MLHTGGHGSGSGPGDGTSAIAQCWSCGQLGRAGQRLERVHPDGPVGAQRRVVAAAPAPQRVLAPRVGGLAPVLVDVRGAARRAGERAADGALERPLHVQAALRAAVLDLEQAPAGVDEPPLLLRRPGGGGRAHGADAGLAVREDQARAGIGDLLVGAGLRGRGRRGEREQGDQGDGRAAQHGARGDGHGELRSVGGRGGGHAASASHSAPRARRRRDRAAPRDAPAPRPLSARGPPARRARPATAPGRR